MSIFIDQSLEKDVYYKRIIKELNILKKIFNSNPEMQEEAFKRIAKIELHLSIIGVLIRQSMDYGYIEYDCEIRGKLSWIIHCETIKTSLSWDILVYSNFINDHNSKTTNKVISCIDELNKLDRKDEKDYEKLFEFIES